MRVKKYGHILQARAAITKLKILLLKQTQVNIIALTHCATGTIEKWEIHNIDTEPKLVKVDHVEQSKP